MPTVIEHRPAVTEGSGAGALIATAVIIVLGILFFLYALPALRDNSTEVNVPGVDIQTDGQ